MCWSQVDSTKYWVTYPQLQEMYHIILVGDECAEDNHALERLVAYNDSLSQAKEEARKNLKAQLSKRTSQYQNEQLKYQQAEEKFDIADNAYKEEKRKKTGWFVAAVLEAIGLLILILT